MTGVHAAERRTRDNQTRGGDGLALRRDKKFSVRVAGKNFILTAESSEEKISPPAQVEAIKFPKIGTKTLPLTYSFGSTATNPKWTSIISACGSI